MDEISWLKAEVERPAKYPLRARFLQNVSAARGHYSISTLPPETQYWEHSPWFRLAVGTPPPHLRLQVIGRKPLSFRKQRPLLGQFCYQHGIYQPLLHSLVLTELKLEDQT